MRIFISVASPERSSAEEIALALRGDGHTVFLDDTDLPPANTFHERIRQAIQDADLMIFLVSPSSVHPKRYTLSELKFARDQWPHPRNRVLPVMAVATPMDTVPPYLKAVSIYSPKGDLAAEVSYEVERMAKVQVAKKTTTDTVSGIWWTPPAEAGSSPRPSVELPSLPFSMLLFAMIGCLAGLVCGFIIMMEPSQNIYGHASTFARAMTLALIVLAVTVYYEIADLKATTLAVVSVFIGFLAAHLLAAEILPALMDHSDKRLNPFEQMFVGSARAVLIAVGMSIAYRELSDARVYVFCAVFGGVLEVLYGIPLNLLFSLSVGEALAAALLCYLLGSIAFQRQARLRKVGDPGGFASLAGSGNLIR